MKRKNLEYNLSGKSILFATFSRWIDGKRLPTNGSIEPFRNFIVPRVKKFVLIDQLVPDSESVMPKYEVYEYGSMKFKSYPPPQMIRAMSRLFHRVHSSGTSVLFKIRDFLSVVLWGISDNTVFDYCIGLESINAIAGIMLRSLGKVKQVVYYVSDYSPNRYPNKWFNALYLWLDRYAAMHADFIWDVSKAMQKARIAAGLNFKKSAPVIHVANGLFPDQIISGTSRKRGHALAYMGTVGPENGPDVAIEALAIVRKKYSDAVLHMIGGKSSDFAWLIPMIKKCNMENTVIHHGFVPKAGDMTKIMRTCMVGLAPYRAILGSPRYYGDAGKIRAYCGAGLPIISSPVPPLGLEVAEQGAAIIAKDDPESLAEAIIKLFSDENLYNRLQIKAIQFAKENTWENQFANAFKEMRDHE